MHMTWTATTRWSVLLDLFRANTGPRVHFRWVKKAEETIHRIALLTLNARIVVPTQIQFIYPVYQ